MKSLPSLVLLLGACAPGPSFFGGSGNDATDDTSDTDTDDSGLGDVFSDLDWHLSDDIASLVYVTWSQSESGTATVEYSFDEGEWLSTPSAAAAEGVNEALLLGVPFDSSVRFRVSLLADEGSATSEEMSATTGPIPDGLVVPTLTASDAEAWFSEGRYLMGSVNSRGGGWSGGNYWRFIIDRQARVVWAMLTPSEHWSIFSRVARNGHDILYDEATYWSDWDGGAGSKIHRIKIDGSVVETIAAPGLHHAFTELADGSLAWGAAIGWSDESLWVRSTSGDIENIWNCGDFQSSIGARGECQSNTLFWDESNDTFLYSFYTSSSIVRIDHTTGETLDVWGHWPTAFDFDPVDSSFYWQHGSNITDSGTLLTSTYSAEENSELAAREYEIDEASHSLHQIWSFGKGQGVKGDTAGEAHRLANGNTLHNYGSGSRVREVTPAGDVVWDVEWSNGHLLGRTVFLSDLYDFAP